MSEHSDLFEVYALTANNQVDLLINQARKYMPEVVVIANERKYPELKEALEDLPIKVWAGDVYKRQMYCQNIHAPGWNVRIGRI